MAPPKVFARPIRLHVKVFQDWLLATPKMMKNGFTPPQRKILRTPLGRPPPIKHTEAVFQMQERLESLIFWTSRRLSSSLSVLMKGRHKD